MIERTLYAIGVFAVLLFVYGVAMSVRGIIRDFFNDIWDH